MTLFLKKNKFPYIIGIAFAILVFLNLFFNRQIERKVKGGFFHSPLNIPYRAFSKSEYFKKIQETTPAIPFEKSTSEGVVRKTRVERGSDLVEHIFYQDGKEVARETIFADGRTERKGTIPDGKVKFYDEYNHSRGEEYYLDGKKNGTSKTYYPEGLLKSESKYLYGHLLTTKEYYPNGTLRFEVDYTDSRDSKDLRETGVGKLYYPNGKIKYEWNMTNAQRIGFKKSYNPDGTLRVATYYDERGQPITP